MRTIRILLSLFLLAILAVAASIWSGVYPIGADVPHWPLVYNLLETTRQRSITLRAKDIQVPPLDDPKLIADGGEHYGAMCSGCHLAPGMTDSEIRKGLYPQPPDLTKALRANPAEEFWTIKHGIKLSAMPAWGMSHDDPAIWGLVAFLQKLPGMTPDQYKTLTGGAEGNGEHAHHHHGDADHGHDEQGHSERGDTSPGSEEGHDESAHTHEHGAAAQEDHRHAAPAKVEPPISMEELRPGAVPAAEAAAHAFDAALESGDREKVLALLAADAKISESGVTQSRDEYADHHLGEDIAFLNSAQVKVTFLGSMSTSNGAIVGSERSITTRGGTATIRSREMLTLKKYDGVWKIQIIRWQSAQAKE